ncbi:MAG: SAM-dependent methyltransferase [Lachnospiraceae bacterium]|nr:SAM-dependent methyltransferase [Lachnospiraceae bacterium]
MKAIDGYDKLRGGYYTPRDIADFIVGWAVRTHEDSILEPGCGDGSFLAAVKRRQEKLLSEAENQNLITQVREMKVTGIELDPAEAKKATAYGYEIINDDFFTWYKDQVEERRTFDVVVGNPPFVRYQNFAEQYRSAAFELMKKHGFHPNRLTNIWLPFLLLSVEALSENGRLGMVIPAELFQVDYAAEARNYLSTAFEGLTLITFRKLVFDDIQQEVVLLLGEKKSERKGIRVIELEDLEELNCVGMDCLTEAEIKEVNHSTEKWVRYYLTNEEIGLLNELNSDNRISDASDLYEVNVGLVSGENDFFLFKWKDVLEWHLENDVTPIISRAEQVKGIMLSELEYRKLRDAGKRVSMFAPGDLPMEEISEQARQYIAWGESRGFQQNYKCRIRKRWYCVPNSWKADAFLIRQANLYPKMILNKAGALVTDTLHKVRFHEGINAEAVTSAFLNTYTLALSETLGRSYGGGVLTFEPGEMRKFRIPMKNAEKLDINRIDRLQREGKYEEILAYTDEILLKDGLNMTEHDIQLLHSIWNKMRDRRLARKTKKNL